MNRGQPEQEKWRSTARQIQSKRTEFVCPSSNRPLSAASEWRLTARQIQSKRTEFVCPSSTHFPLSAFGAPAAASILHFFSFPPPHRLSFDPSSYHIQNGNHQYRRRGRRGVLPRTLRRSGGLRIVSDSWYSLLYRGGPPGPVCQLGSGAEQP
jgi:hypothetical protein